MPVFLPNFTYSFDEATDSTSEFPLQNRTFDRPVVFTPITQKCHQSRPDSSFNRKPTPKVHLPPMEDTLLRESYEQLPTLITDRSSPRFGTNLQNRPTRSKSKTVQPAMNRTWRAHSVVDHLEDDNRLRGGATIVAKLPYSRGNGGNSRKSFAFRRPDMAIKGSSDAPSVSSVSSLTRPHLLGVNNNSRIRATSSSGQSSSERGCYPYQVRGRNRSVGSEQCRMQDGSLMITDPRRRCTESRRLQTVLSHSTTAVNSRHTPSSVVRCPIFAKRAFSMEDAMIQLSKRCNSPPSDYTGSSSASSRQKQMFHRTLSANRITDQLRAKLGLNPHQQNSSIETANYIDPDCNAVDSYERIMYENAIASQTFASSSNIGSIGVRSYSDSQLDLARHKFVCHRCMHQCNLEDGNFICDTCVEIQKVRNAFVIEIFSDRTTSDAAKPEQMTCYGVRIGAGILPVVVIFISLFICSVILLSDSFLSNICAHSCDAPKGYRSYSSLWRWFDPSK